MTSVKAGGNGFMISRLVKKIKNSLQALWHGFADTINANKKKSILDVFLALLLVIALTFLTLTVNSKIRAAQMDNLIYEDLPTKKIVPFSYGEGDKMINEKKAVSVMFAKPNQTETRKALQIIKQKEDELNRKFYYYPLVYQTPEIKNTYNIASDEVTFVFFQNGEEKNRFTLNSVKDPKENFIPELNRLPMWNIEVEENKK